MARKVIEFEHIPGWAIYSLEYGTDSEVGLSVEDSRMIDDFIAENFPDGYCMSVDWNSFTEFDVNPAFGKACSTYTVCFIVD